MVEETAWQKALRDENRANPYPFYAELRKTPVARQPDGSYVISTYQEVVQLLHDPRVSSDSTKRASGESLVGGALKPTIITEDPPEHDRDRRLLMRHFGPPHSPHMIADLEPEIRTLVACLLDKMKGKTRIDVVDEFAYPLPVTMICKILGVPLEDAPRFHSWIEETLDAFDLAPQNADASRSSVGARDAQKVVQFLSALLDRYAEQPAPGMLSAMVNDDSPGERLSRDALLSNAVLLLFAGHETSVNLISHSVLTLLRHPDALEQLRRRPELIVPGIEEFVRLESSVQFWHTRSVLDDIDIGGTTIPKGSPIYLLYGAANRDPNRFAHPDEVDLERADNQHLGYSQGIHVCFGAPLARLEVQAAVGEFVRRVVNPRLVEDPPPYRHNPIFRGPRHLWVDIDGVQD